MKKLMLWLLGFGVGFLLVLSSMLFWAHQLAEEEARTRKQTQLPGWVTLGAFCLAFPGGIAGSLTAGFLAWLLHFKKAD